MPAKATTDRRVKHWIVWHKSESFHSWFLTWEKWRKWLNLLIIALFFAFLLLFPWFLASLWGRAFPFFFFVFFLLCSSKQQKHTTENHLETRLSASPIQSKKADFWCLTWSTTCSALHVSQPNWKSVTVPSFQKMEALRIQNPAGSVGSSPYFARLSVWAAQPENSW